MAPVTGMCQVARRGSGRLGVTGPRGRPSGRARRVTATGLVERAIRARVDREAAASQRRRDRAHGQGRSPAPSAWVRHARWSLAPRPARAARGPRAARTAYPARHERRALLHGHPPCLSAPDGKTTPRRFRKRVTGVEPATSGLASAYQTSRSPPSPTSRQEIRRIRRVPDFEAGCDGNAVRYTHGGTNCGSPSRPDAQAVGR